MKTAVRACSITLRDLLTEALMADGDLAAFFNAGSGGTMLVGLATPEEMVEANEEGVAVWLYRVQRDEHTLNLPPRRLAPDRRSTQPLPLRLHYLVVPLVARAQRPLATELEQHVLGKVLQVFHDRPNLRGPLLHDDLAGTPLELMVRLEPLSLEEITRVWDALDLSYRLCVSYEVSVVPIDSALAIESVSPVQVVLPEYGIATPAGGAP